MRRPRKPRAELQAIVDRFNAEHPVGSVVDLRRDIGWITTKVFAPATILQGHTAVAWFYNVRGCHSIEDDRVRVPAETASS